MKEMSKEEYLKKVDEILETISCRNSLEDEVLKLFCLFSRCVTVNKDGEEFLHAGYVREKAGHLLSGWPIILDMEAQKMFCYMKMNREIITGNP